MGVDRMLAKSDSLTSEIIVTDNQGNQYSDSIIITVLTDNSQKHSVDVSWIAPMENENGSQLTNLAGYKIYLIAPSAPSKSCER